MIPPVLKFNVILSFKRKILSQVATIYDPLGFLSPVILLAKKFLQNIWSSGTGWDDPVHESILHDWDRWCKELGLLESLRISRPLTISSSTENIQIHAFCDASTVGYGAVVYLRVQYLDASIKNAFVIAKSRVAPLKPLTIPRLELQGAVVAVRLVQTVLKTLRIKIDQIFYWTDSFTVLQWIKSKHRKFHTFVSHRIAEIIEFSTPESWFHIAGVNNPADEASRGLFPLILSLISVGSMALHSFFNQWRTGQSL